MTKSRFSSNFLSLQLQLKTILEEAGGDDLMPFLDTLSSMNKSEQMVALRLFKRTLDRFVGGSMRLETLGDLALKEFEDSLFSGLLDDVAALKENRSTNGGSKRKGNEGGILSEVSASMGSSRRNTASSANDNGVANISPIDLAAERARRKVASPEILPAS
jgi:hypothetical protein